MILLTKFKKSRFTRGHSLSPLKIVNSCVEHLARGFRRFHTSRTLAAGVVGSALCSLWLKIVYNVIDVPLNLDNRPMHGKDLQAPGLSTTPPPQLKIWFVGLLSKAWRRPPPLRVKNPQPSSALVCAMCLPLLQNLVRSEESMCPLLFILCSMKRPRWGCLSAAMPIITIEAFALSDGEVPYRQVK